MNLQPEILNSHLTLIGVAIENSGMKTNNLANLNGLDEFLKIFYRKLLTAYFLFERTSLNEKKLNTELGRYKFSLITVYLKII